MTSLPAAPLSVALVGAGRVGTAVAQLLSERGVRIAGVASRTRGSAEAAARRLGAPVLDRPAPVDAVLLGTPAGALAEAARWYAPAVTDETVLVHFAGVAGVGPVTAVARRVCAVHPVQACPTTEIALMRLPGSAWGVTTTPGDQGWAEAFVRSLGGEPVPVAEADRPLWHAAAVTTSNGIAGLLAAGESILAAIGVADPAAVLMPIAAGTVANAADGGGGAATLTGPAVRGETATLRAHIDALRARAPELVDGYVLAGRLVVEAAHRSGRIEPGAEDALKEALS